jgi:hypothetical protein
MPVAGGPAKMKSIIFTAMKKYMLLTMMSVFLLAGSSEAADVCASPLRLPEVWIKLTIKFHRPKTDCQTGFGICFDLSAGIENPVGSNGRDVCPVRARLNDKNQLVLEVAETALTAYENGGSLPYFQGKTSVTIIDPYSLSAGTCKALGSSPPLTIKPGNYPVSFANGIYTVVFQL